MKTFEFSKNVVESVIRELTAAKEYIRVAIFQLHNQEVFEVLTHRLRNGVKVEVFTLPYDSVNEDVQEEVTELFRNLEGNGARLYFCKWNVGDPERTSTAVGRWYSFHGKFIVTERAAIALSANFTQTPELDGCLIFRNEIAKVREYNAKFDELLSLFVTPDSGHDGIIYRRIVETKLPRVSSVFELPRVIDTPTHKSHWIREYPASLCPSGVLITDKLYLIPFDAQGRDLFMSVISQASEFAYISTESFTDRDFADFLIRARLKGLEVRILSGATSMDFSDRFQDMLRDLLAQGIAIRTTDEDLHAKLIVTDKHVVISSVNLNKINLGFEKTKAYWRENTETAEICSASHIRTEAKAQFLHLFDQSSNIENKLAERIEKTVGDMLSTTFNLRSRRETKQAFALLILKEQIETKKVMLRVGRIISKIMRLSGRVMVEKEDFFMALLLDHLAERKQDVSELQDKVHLLDPKIDVGNLLSQLSDKHLIEKDGDDYKVNIGSLFERA